ncbi:MAG: thiamine biosynthesis lipoprotein ApbE [Deferribacteraceae bacterium]|jgi:thiamine biosynthesis lipoprotein|nr:thiamine biosynthesis lipoprotein ApbE [Deferribacteraceae bacterium]
MFKKIVFSTLALLLITACNQTFVSKTGFWMGTIVEVTFDADKSKVVDEALRYLESLESKINKFTLNLNEKGAAEYDDDIKYLLSRNDYFKTLSGGRFDISVGTIGYLYGFPEGPYKVPNESTLTESLEKVHKNRFLIKDGKIIKSEDIRIDMGAYAKGYIVDKASGYLKQKGVNNFIFNAGGDLFASGNKNGKKWKIAIKHPDGEGKFLSVIGLSDKAVATSGNYERYFEKDGKRYIHIFDALSGENANNYKSISVISENVEKADGLATVFFLLSKNDIKSICAKENTPVMIYTLDNKLLKYCGWENFEIN